MAQTSVAVARYPMRWLLVWGAIVALAASPWLITRRAPAARAPMPHAGAADWFYVVRLPEMPREEAELASAVAQVDGWLQALHDRGFVPMRLSEVQHRRAQGVALPPRTVVLLITPGYRRTYLALAPLFAQRGWPAGMVTDQQAIDQSDRHYVSQHDLSLMQQGGLWDVGLFQDGQMNASFQLTSPESQPKPSAWAWSQQAGRRALNREVSLRGLACLHAQLAWNASELLDRLLTEEPIKGQVYLTMRSTSPPRWEIAQDGIASQAEGLITVQAPRDARSSTIMWPSTIGCRDFQLELATTSLVGELWLLLRTDAWAQQSVRVGFAEQQILIEQEHDGRRERLATLAVPPLRHVPFRARLLLQGDRLQIDLDGQPLPACRLRAAPTSDHGIIKLMVYDKVRGAARLDTLRLLLTPLTNPDASSFGRNASRVAALPRPLASVVVGRSGFVRRLVYKNSQVVNHLVLDGKELVTDRRSHHELRTTNDDRGGGPATQSRGAEAPRQDDPRWRGSPAGRWSRREVPRDANRAAERRALHSSVEEA